MEKDCFGRGGLFCFREWSKNEKYSEFFTCPNAG